MVAAKRDSWKRVNGQEEIDDRRSKNLSGLSGCGGGLANRQQVHGRREAIGRFGWGPTASPESWYIPPQRSEVRAMKSRPNEETW